MCRRFLALGLSWLLAGAVFAAQNPPAGVVLQSQSARLNTADAEVGTTLYDGDRLETQSKGALSVRSSVNQILLTLAEDSLLWMNHENGVLTPKLDRGMVTFRAEMGEGIEVRADDVRVRPHSPLLTIGEVKIDECYIYVTARTQALDVSAGKETKLLEEGKTYRVARAGACGAALQQPAVPVGQSRFFILPAAIAIGIGILGISKGLESPDRP
jgi:ferric-dicitrate binding protein FerR (iron transport regulator)